MATRIRTTVLCLTGPESTGKSTLAVQLAEELTAPLVREFAREYLQPAIEVNTRAPYTESDLREIAAGQVRLEQLETQQAGDWLVCDTDLQVIETWWWFKFGPGDLLADNTAGVAPATSAYPQWLQQVLQQRTQRHYLLLAPDIAWQPDPLREDPGNRQRLFEHYLALMRRDNLSYRVVRGLSETRLQSAQRAIQQLTNPSETQD